MQCSTGSNKFNEKRKDLKQKRKGKFHRNYKIIS